MKTNTKYKLLLLVPMFFVGCTAKHQNVIQDKQGNKFLIRDVKTGVERIYEYDTTDVYKHRNYQYLYVGDTVDVSATEYESNKFLTDKHTDLSGGADAMTIEQRKFDALKQQYFGGKVK